MNIWKRAGVAFLGVGLMWLESRITPEPGIGFAIAMSLIFLSIAID